MARNSKKTEDGEKALSALILREAGTETNRRLLSRLPVFRPDPVLPERMRKLLGELDRAEEEPRLARG
ncbi:hypothetical protein [Aquamicrobium sp. LC103]|uniref:hypothetical protein n=1 Tax=Aquamicrobium sp. LC103 TaxID=1120658 RepID=UPI000A49CAD1|nr:hypothetical protein [Aquamicrobium sp. LC103]TKT82670.1 hypothetical protein XW59_001535 [Aquamicrobium sp. LC103]